MSVSVPTIRFDRQRQEQARVLLLDAAAGLSAALGYRAADDGVPAAGRGARA